MKTPKAYLTLKDQTPEGLDKQVNALLSEGWELHGSQYYCAGGMGYGLIFVQVVTQDAG